MSDIPVVEDPPTGFVLTGKVYDILKWVVSIVLPALGTLYFTLAETWDWTNPDPTKVLGTLIAITAFLGLVLGISTRTYNASGAKYDGALTVQITPDDEPNKLIFPNEAVEQLGFKDELTLKVNREMAPVEPTDDFEE